MQYKRFLLITFIVSVTLGIAGCNKQSTVNIIIPAPLSIEEKDGSFDVPEELALYTNLTGDEREYMLGYLPASSMNFKLVDNEPDRGFLKLMVDRAAGSQPGEGYELRATTDGVVILAVDGSGIFYGLQSFLQLARAYGDKIPCMIIKDAPRFPYRGFHLDVSRHFFDKEFVKKQIDIMAHYKLNRFHWHLTDGAGWRIKIEKYPLLTEVAAWRPDKTYMEWTKNGKRYSSVEDTLKYGGFYTQEDIREVVEYAKARHITIIPEIEMPGHSEEVLAVYPHLSCSGLPYVDSDFCVGNEETFDFLENVLTETMLLFPSEYIHIGGDEATKKGWAECAKCKRRMQQENLNNLDELQNYMILRIEKFLNSHGRKLLGWDEILEGGLSKSATVMAWRGVESGLKSIRLGNNTIMTPDAYCYFDHYQDAPPLQPEAMPALLPLEKAYSFDPAPDSLGEAEKALVYGVQANLWTEYMPTRDHVEYMAYPRLLALAEVAWSQPERKSFTGFRERALAATAFLKDRGYHPFELANEIGKRPQSLKAVRHKALDMPVEYSTSYHQKYVAAGKASLTDGLLGDWSYSDKRWQGFLENDVDVTVDLGRITGISSISAQFMQQASADIWMPSKVEIHVSPDGTDYFLLTEIKNEIPVNERKIIYHDFGWQGSVNTRFIRYKASDSGIKGGWLFTDEIVVN